jgi:hypothetical protein
MNRLLLTALAVFALSACGGMMPGEDFEDLGTNGQALSSCLEICPAAYDQFGSLGGNAYPAKTDDQATTRSNSAAPENAGAAVESTPEPISPKVHCCTSSSSKQESLSLPSRPW